MQHIPSGFQTLALCVSLEHSAGQGVAVFGPVTLPPGSNNFSIWPKRALGFYFIYNFLRQILTVATLTDLELRM